MARYTLMVASVGGHLEELYELRHALLGAEEIPIWVTFDGPQSRSLLRDEDNVFYLRRVGSRGFIDLLRVLRPAIRLLRHERPARVLSTGAGVALAFLPLAWVVRAEALYVESAARTHGPSLTGKLLRLAPWIRLRTQYPAWAGRRWKFEYSVFDGYRPTLVGRDTPRVRVVVVTLGTQEGFPFVSLVRQLREVVPEDVEVRWQIGPGFPEGEKPFGAHEIVPRSDLLGWLSSADAVVTHAGVGSALSVLGVGKAPVLVPRSARNGEHVDDHQREIAAELQRRGLAVQVTAEQITWEHVVQSTRLGVTRIRTEPGTQT